MNSRSEPPPSYPPPASEGQRVSSTELPGWRPADDDVSLRAVDWRARTSLRRVDRALTVVDKLTTNVETLNTTIHAWNTRWDKHWTTISRLAWAVGVPLLVAAMLGIGAQIWRWISTLHH